MVFFSRKKLLNKLLKKKRKSPFQKVIYFDSDFTFFCFINMCILLTVIKIPEVNNSIIKNYALKNSKGFENTIILHTHAMRNRDMGL